MTRSPARRFGTPASHPLRGFAEAARFLMPAKAQRSSPGALTRSVWLQRPAVRTGDRRTERRRAVVQRVRRGDRRMARQGRAGPALRREGCANAFRRGMPARSSAPTKRGPATPMAGRTASRPNAAFAPRRTPMPPSGIRRAACMDRLSRGGAGRGQESPAFSSRSSAGGSRAGRGGKPRRRARPRLAGCRSAA